MQDYSTKTHFGTKKGAPLLGKKTIQQRIELPELLMNLLRKNIPDKRVIKLIKRCLKAGVMGNGLRVKTEEGSPRGKLLSPLLADIYLNEYDQRRLFPHPPQNKKSLRRTRQSGVVFSCDHRQ